MLREMGSILRQLGRETDVVARFGGEEFCVLCEETGERGAALLVGCQPRRYGRIRRQLVGTKQGER